MFFQDILKMSLSKEEIWHSYNFKDDSVSVKFEVIELRSADNVLCFVLVLYRAKPDILLFR